MKLSGISLESLEPAIEKIAALTPVQRILICVLTVGFLAGGFGYFFYYPQYIQLDKMTGQLKQLDQQLATARTAAAQIGKFRQEMKDAEEDFRVSRNALPDKEEIPLLLTSISQFGHDAGLEFILFEPKPEIIKDFYAEIPVSITVSGKLSSSRRVFRQGFQSEPDCQYQGYQDGPAWQGHQDDARPPVMQPG